MTKIYKINNIYAFIGKDQCSGEEIIVQISDRKNKLPMVFTEKTCVEKMKDIAQVIGEKLDMEINLVNFTLRAEIETIVPQEVEQIKEAV
jgi:hypothetical protein